MRSLGKFFVKIKRAFMDVDGLEIVKIEHMVHTKEAVYTFKLLMEKRTALKLVDPSSEQEECLQPLPLVKE